MKYVVFFALQEPHLVHTYLKDDTKGGIEKLKEINFQQSAE